MADTSTTDPIVRLSKDLKAASGSLSRDEARYLVDCYYQLQGLRIATAHQARTLAEGEEPNSVIHWFTENAGRLEDQVRRALDGYSDGTPTGRWAKSLVGIGPVIAAGLLAHIDITRAPTVGHIWRFAGLDPTCKWEKGQRRPWNARLKVLCWKAGESFVKTSGNEHSIYGKLWAQRKEQERARNDRGEFAEQAAANLQKLRRADTTTAKANRAGKLSDGHIHDRAKRWAVKLFLSTFHEVAYVEHYGTAPPRPYVFSHLEHAHEIEAIAACLPKEVLAARRASGAWSNGSA